MNDDSAPATDLVGTILAGRYRIVQRLGEGAMGAVYLGEHLKIGRRDAIKVLRDTLATDREATLRFLRGARNVSAIRHPNVCTIYDFSDTADGLQFLAMEYVEGGTLKELLDRERRLPASRAIDLAVQTADALDAAHDAGIVHRDLKPGNIMLVSGRGGREVVKVVDFDIAKGPDADGEEVTRLGFVVGTPEYMSPEQLMGETLDGRSDVYSLALVLFRTLTGALPFQAESTQDVMIQRLTHAPLRLAETAPGLPFPDGLQQVLDHGLQRRPADRPDAEQFGRELKAVLAGTPVAAPAAVPHDARFSPPVGTPGAGRTGGETVQHGGAGSTGGSAAAVELPPTRVAPAGTVPRTAPGGSAVARRNIAVAAAVVMVAIIATSAMLMRGGSSATDDGVTPSSADGNPAASVPPAESTTVAADTDADAVAPQADAREGATASVTESGASTRSDDVEVSAPAITIDPERADAVLFRQLDRFPPVAASAPTAGTLVAIADTARAVWAMDQLSSTDRALAAYVLGEAHNAGREWSLCVQWLDSALVLAPANASYTAMRSNCQGQIR